MAACCSAFTQQRNIAAYSIFMIAFKKQSHMLLPEAQLIKVFNVKSFFISLDFFFKF